STGNVADKRNVLFGQRVDHTRLTGVSSAENTNVDTHPFWGLIHLCHDNSSVFRDSRWIGDKKWSRSPLFLFNCQRLFFNNLDDVTFDLSRSMVLSGLIRDVAGSDSPNALEVFHGQESQRNMSACNHSGHNEASPNV